jgi:hypothetical protein
LAGEANVQFCACGPVDGRGQRDFLEQSFRGVEIIARKRFLGGRYERPAHEEEEQQDEYECDRSDFLDRPGLLQSFPPGERALDQAFLLDPGNQTAAGCTDETGSRFENVSV